MAANLTIALASGQLGPSPGENGMIRETVSVTGSSSSSGDTGTYTTKFVKRPIRFIGGPFTFTFSDQVMTLTDEAGIGSLVSAGYVEGYA